VVASGQPLPPELLAGAHQRSCSLELLGREKPQRVAHQNRHAATASVVVSDCALEPADRQGERGEPEVRLGLAAPSREEQQVDESVPGRSFRVDRVGECRKVDEQEGELEGPPRVVLGSGELGHRGVEVEIGATAPTIAGKGVHALQPHGVVGEPERFCGVDVNAEERDAGAQSPSHLPSVIDRYGGGIFVPWQARLGVADTRLLLVEPPLVGVRQVGESSAKGLAVESGQHLHVQHDLG
jgi:hypothetical protein